MFKLIFFGLVTAGAAAAARPNLNEDTVGRVQICLALQAGGVLTFLVGLGGLAFSK